MARQLRDYLALPDGHYFGAVTLGAARIVFIDTGEDKHDSHPEYSGLVDFDHYIERQKAWLSREFASAAWKDAVFRIAVMHIPPADVSVLARLSFDYAKERIPTGIWQHFKGNRYETLGIAKHSETLEPMVVYRALYGEGGIWVRPAAMWLETVTREGKTFPRFTYLSKKEEI
jgi:hypothetical protein